jgi:hypothetical protein
LPVAGTTPLSGPRLVPSDRTRTATVSPSATIASIVMCRSGNWASNHSAVWRMAAGPLTLPGSACPKGATACSRYSWAISSSATARSLRFQISSKCRRTSSLSASNIAPPRRTRPCQAASLAAPRGIPPWGMPACSGGQAIATQRGPREHGERPQRHRVGQTQRPPPRSTTRPAPSLSLRHEPEVPAAVWHGRGRGGRLGVDRARWGASGALYPQTALAGLNSCPRVRVRRERRARSVDGQVPRNVTL